MGRTFQSVSSFLYAGCGSTQKNEDRPDRAADGKRAAEALWRHRAIVSYLTEELVELGHEVTLFASGDSITGANLVRCAPRRCGSTPTCAIRSPITC